MFIGMNSDLMAKYVEGHTVAEISEKSTGNIHVFLCHSAGGRLLEVALYDWRLLSLFGNAQRNMWMGEGGHRLQERSSICTLRGVGSNRARME